MAPPVFIEPDLDFIAQINSDSGLNLKKCYQCATCSVVCTLSDDDQPFPRKEMIYASWGLKDRLIANPDIWLCYNCGDCSTLCPRDARPGDVLNTLRKMSIGEYSKPAVLHRLLNDIRKLPLLFIIPALIILAMGFATGFMNLSPGGDRIVFAHFCPFLPRAPDRDDFHSPVPGSDPGIFPGNHRHLYPAWTFGNSRVTGYHGRCSKFYSCGTTVCRFFNWCPGDRIFFHSGDYWWMEFIFIKKLKTPLRLMAQFNLYRPNSRVLNAASPHPFGPQYF